MSYRSLNSTLQTSLIDGDSYGYAHLIKFEKPIPATELTYSDRTKPSNRAINYAYLTDGAYDIEFDDGSVDASGTPNGDQNYLANKVLNVGTSSETIQAKATGMNLVLAADAVGVSINGTFAFTSTDITAPSGTTWTDQGFQEGDTIKFTGNGANNGAIVRIDTFTNSNTKAKYTALPKDDGTVSSVATQSATYTVKYHSPEINALTTLKSDPSFSSYLNREVFIYRAHINPATGAIIGGNAGVFLLFKGIITGGKLQEDPLKGSKISWNLTSHWGDFVQVKGRNTSDAGHRGLNTGGVTDVEAVFRPEYASDLGFVHSEQAVNITATYQVMEQRMGTRQASGFFNGSLFGMDEAYTYDVPVDKDVDLEFNLQARYLPVVYGVQKIGSIPFFADGAKENAKVLFVASALCEGPVHSIMDMHVEDEPLVCMNAIDVAERRGSNSEANVVCFGRADKGDVLRGNNHVVDPATLNARDDIVNDINLITHYINTQGGYSNVGSAAFEQLSRLRSQLGAYDEAIANFTGNAGLTHEKKFNFSSPMDTEFTFHAGRSDQEADTLFAHQAGTRQFKLQSMYHTDKPGSEYWGVNHRVLDTCYIAQKFTINAEEFTIPKTEYVIKGRVLDCYNYDRSYYGNKTFNSSTTHADFLLGDEVKLFKPDSTRLYDGSNTTEVVQIIDKFSFYNDTGTLEYRYRFSKNLHLAEDNSNLSADLTHFYMEHKTDNSKRWYFATHDGAVEKADASGLIRNVPLPSQTIFNNTDNSAVAFSASTMTLNLSSGSTTINTKILTGLPTGDATLAMGKYLAFYIQYGTGDEYRYFALPILSYNSGNGTVTFDVEQQPLVDTIDNVLTQAKQAIAAGVSDAKWNIVVSDVVKLGGSLDSTDDKYNTSNLVIKHIAGNGNIVRRVKIIDDYDASEALVRVREPYLWSTFPQSTGPGRSGSTYNFDIEGSVDIDVAGFNSIAGKGADRRVSINPAIQLLDYLTNERYGKGLDKDKDLDLESFLAAARVCDTRSDVTMVVKTSTLTTTPTEGAVYKYPSSGSPILFQGTVKGTPVTYDVTGLGDSSRTNFTEIVFTDVIGQLGRKWNDYRTYEASRHVIYYDGSAFTASSTGTMDETARDSAITNNLLTGVVLTRVSGTGDGTVTINVEKKFGNAGNGNPVVRKYSPVDGIFNAMGYSLYDGDDCKYWKLLGWDEQEQRNVTRHQTNITLNTSEPVFANINVLLSQFNGMLRYGNGKYSLAIRQKAPDDAHFTSFPAKVINEEDIIGSISIDDGTSKKKLNQISANIIDPSLRFGGRGITFSNSEYVKQDRGIKKEGNYSSPGISNYFNARIAVKQQLDESRFGLTVKFTIDSAGYLLQAGEIIRINYSRFNWTDKEYRIQSLNFAANGTVQVVAREHNDNAYIVEYVDDFQNGDTLDGGSQGGRSFTAPGAPTNGNTTTDQAGRVKLTWTNGTDFVPTVQATQVARHPTNVTPNAAGDNVTIIADTQQDNFIDTAPGDFASGDVSHYYWVRHAYSRNHGSTASVERNKFTAWLALGQGTAKVTSIVEIDGGITINDGGLTLASSPTGTPAYKAGQTDFDTGTGFFLGRHSGAYKLSVGNSSGNKLTFDGTNLSVTGTITGSAFESGTLKGTHSNAIPTDIFTRSTNRTRPVNSETGGFIDLTTGHFIFGNATKFIAFGPDDDNNDAVGVRGDLIADNLIANTAIETPLLKVGAIQANTIGVAELKEEVFSEIDSRLGNSGGYYASYETGVSNTDDGYLGTTGTTFVKELTGSANAGYQHKGEKTFLSFSINDAFSAPRASSQTGRSGDDLKITVTLQKADQTSGTPSYSNLATKVMTLTETHLQHATSFTLSDTLSHVIDVGTTGHDVDDYYFYRVVITASTSLSMFREFSSGDSTSGANDSSGTPILFEVREGAIGTTAGNLGSSGDIIHDGDPDTKIVFNDDEIVLEAGGETMATFTEAASDTITLHKDTTVSTNLTVTGDLTVNGTTTTLNTETLDVEDKNITVAKGAANKAAADGAGLTVDIGTNDPVISTPTFTYTQSDDSWNMNKDLRIVTGLADATFEVGRDAGNQYLQLHITDSNNTITAKQDSDSNGAHSFILNRDFAGSGANDFRIQKGGTTELLIDTNGNVGIGTTSPAGNLHIRSTNNIGDALLIIEADADNNVETDNPRIELRQDNNLVTGAIYMEGNAGATATSTLANSLIFDAKASSTAGSHSLQFVTGGLAANQSGGPTNGSVKMTIMDSGRVGIGTNSPNRPLTVHATPQTFGSTQSVLQLGDNSEMAAGVGGGVTFTGKATTGQTDSNTAFAAIHGEKENASSGNTSGAMIFSTRTNGSDPAERMRIDSSGKVGIGTTSPSQTLDVAGNIQATGSRTIAALYDSNHYMRLEGNSAGGVLKGADGGVIKTLVRSYGDSYFNSGNVGIGNTNPAQPLHITETGNGSAPSDVLTIETTRSDVGTAFTGGAIKFVNSDGNSAGEARIKVGSANSGTTIGLNAEAAQSFIFETSLNQTKATTSIDGNATTITVTHAAHTFTAGQKIAINTGDYQGSYYIDTIVSGTQFTIADTAHDLDADTSGTPVVHFAEPQDSMIIRADGNVGIGTNSPQDALHINSDTTDARLLLDGHTNFDAELKFAENGSVKYTVGHDAATDTFRIGTTNVDTNPRLVINSSGNVGIGTTSPARRLEVDFTGSTYGARFTRSDAAGNSLIEFANNGGVKSVIGFDSGNSGFIVSTGGDPQVVVKNSTGNVGIGTSSPATKLQVEDLGIETTSTAVSSTDATVVDTFAHATFRTARYTVQITQGTAYQCSDIMAIHDGTTAIGTEYAMLETGSVLGTLDVAINGDNVELSVTMTAADAATVKVVRHCVAV